MQAVLTTACGSGLASVLVVSGVRKLVAPNGLAQALHELGIPRLLTRPAVVRGFAAAEVCTATAVTLPWRAVATSLGIAVALSFVALGVLGVSRPGNAACGCFGQGKGHPLGFRNIVAGLAVLICVAVSAVVPESLTNAQRFVVEGSVTSVAAVGLSLWLDRRLVSRLILSPGPAVER
ncbi:MAG: MauE/DoxX family redox-associated membrane protein [Solirubrobacteraceae bacterium]